MSGLGFILLLLGLTLFQGSEPRNRATYTLDLLLEKIGLGIAVVGIILCIWDFSDFIWNWLQ